MMIEIIHLERLRRERLAYEAAQRYRACAPVGRPADAMGLRSRDRRSAILGCCAAPLGDSIVGSLEGSTAPQSRA